MKIKTFQALTMQEALRTIKAELGPDAVILSTKQVRRGGALFGLFGRPWIEVTAAVDVDPAARPAAPPPSSGPGPVSLEGAGSQFERELRRAGAGPPPPEEGPSPTQPLCPSCVRAPGEGPDAAWVNIRAELVQMRRLLEQAAGSHAAHEPPCLPPPLQAARDQLVRAGLSVSTALQLVARLATTTPPTELKTDATVRAALARLLIQETKTGGPLLAPGEWKKTVMLVGPTGVGKTTTIAKLAAHSHGQERRAVALVTMDTYRVAAVEQLRLFAQTIGVPLDIALTPEELPAIVRRRAQADLILVDTPGWTPLDPDQMAELQRIVTTNCSLEIHLVLSATTRDEDLLDAVDRYAALPINRLLFTKLDETTRYGAPFELMRRTGWALSYFSTGQHVPEDLELVRAERMADLLLGGRLRPRTRSGLSESPPMPVVTRDRAQPAAPERAQPAAPERARSAAPARLPASTPSPKSVIPRLITPKKGAWWKWW
ncbi:flagellar biosynthesis protein FlhF [Nitrospira sp. Kam-Ns4a]